MCSLVDDAQVSPAPLLLATKSVRLSKENTN